MTDELRVAVAQMGAPPESHDEAIAMLERAIAGAPQAGLIVLPELALCGYGDAERVRRLAVAQDSPFIGQVRDLARRAGKGFIAGYAEQAGEGRYNSALAVGPDGAIRGNYRKVNLWGPYERGLFAPGLPSPVMEWGALKLGLLICYDLEFAEAARDLALRGADTLVVISATSHPYTVVPEALVPARGYENGCHVVYANAAGPDGTFDFIGMSRITAPDGSVLAAASGAEPAIVEADVKRATVDVWRAGHDYLADRRSDLYRMG
ncbi:carbon-nitrogen hydrolase family protein [Ancylobacter sp. MQZ15Z-1]|uniref:Carbon-nitrogen hydrolase family protein n=1 Tax=Ancylobacter mangrovi TaxID=2972472 RepID=A0A9X2PDD5_9HYPH|nr:carbon-nitrogen hydrolase family protein [Ancylobacter mangrovi]MCS0496616.1 carbon-nitrogen hydrolase family protein [Ancylobacter mangrovi]